MFTTLHLAVLAVLAATVACVDLDVNNQTSIQRATSTLARVLYAYHDPASTAGQFNQPEPWYWWLSGSAWTTLVDYTAYTNDTTYVSDIQSALSQNLGPNNDFVPAAQAGWEANDDQVYWVYAALTAMEYKFPALPCEPSGDIFEMNCSNSWEAISINAFEDFVMRWKNDSVTCDGGLKWQYDPTANGWNYKNSVSNGGFFQTAARLARYTGNQTYAEWATKIYDWTSEIGLIGPAYHVFDGTSDANGTNCTEIDHDQWSYNIATYLHGASHMYAYTNGSSVWETRVQGMLAAANSTFFTPFANSTGILYEPECELQAICDTDQASFRGSLAIWMAKSAILVPSIQQDVMSLLKPTAVGAADSCSGLGNDTCGLKWYIGGYDGDTGFGQDLSALDAVLSLLAGNAPKLATSS